MEESAKLQELRKLADVPIRDGEQFLNVMLDIQTMTSGQIRFGLHWKSEMGEFWFHDLDEAIAEVKQLRSRMKGLNG